MYSKILNLDKLFQLFPLKNSLAKILISSGDSIRQYLFYKNEYLTETHLIYQFNARNVLITDVSRVTSTVSRVTYSVFKSLKIVLHSYNDLKIVYIV